MAPDGEGQQLVSVPEPRGNVQRFLQQGLGVDQHPQEVLVEPALLPAVLLLALLELALQLREGLVRVGVGIPDLVGLPAQVLAVALLPVQVVGDALADALQHPPRVLHLAAQHRELLPQGEAQQPAGLAALPLGAAPVVTHPEEQLALLGVIVLLVVPVGHEVVVQRPIGHLRVEGAIEVALTQVAEETEPEQLQEGHLVAAGGQGTPGEDFSPGHEEGGPLGSQGRLPETASASGPAGLLLPGAPSPAGFMGLWPQCLGSRDSSAGCTELCVPALRAAGRLQLSRLFPLRVSGLGRTGSAALSSLPEFPLLLGAGAWSWREGWLWPSGAVSTPGLGGNAELFLWLMIS